MLPSAAATGLTNQRHQMLDWERCFINCQSVVRLGVIFPRPVKPPKLASRQRFYPSTSKLGRLAHGRLGSLGILAIGGGL